MVATAEWPQTHTCRHTHAITQLYEFRSYLHLWSIPIGTCHFPKCTRSSFISLRTHKVYHVLYISNHLKHVCSTVQSLQPSSFPLCQEMVGCLWCVNKPSPSRRLKNPQARLDNKPLERRRSGGGLKHACLAEPVRPCY